LIVLPLFLGTWAGAQSQTWNVSGGGTWDLVTSNWTPGGTWTNGNDAIFSGTSGTITLSGSILANNLTFNSNGWTLSGGGTLGLAAGSIVDVASGAVATINAAINAGGITKNGVGVLYLGTLNSFGGNVLVNNGVLRITNAGALGDVVGNTTVMSGARLELSGGITVSGETLTINGPGNNNGALQSITGSNTWAGNVIIGTNVSRIGASGVSAVLTISGVIDDVANTFSLAIRSSDSTGQTILTGANTYGGTTDVVVGILKIGGADNRLPTGTTLQLGNAGAIQAATFDLNGFNQTIAGLVSLGAQVGPTYHSTVTNTSVTGSTLTVNGATGSTFAGLVSGNLGLSKMGAGTLTLSGNNTYTGATSVSAGVLVLSGNNSLSGNVTIGGSTVTLSGSNTFSGQIQVNNLGILQLNNALALGLTDVATVVNSGGRVDVSATISGQTIYITGNGGADSSGALRSVASGSGEWAGNVVVASTGARIGGGVSGTLTVSGVISGGGTAGVVFSRAQGSTTILNAVNTYTGPTTMYAAGAAGSRLVIGVDNAIPVSSILNTLGALATQSMQLDLNGHSQTLAGLDSSANHTSGTFMSVTTGVATDSTLTISGTSPYNFSGVITDGAGTLHFVKEGSGTQALFGNNTYTGTTTVRAGTLQVGFSTLVLGASGRLASESILITGGILRIDNTGLANNSADRLANGAVVTFEGGSLVFAGSDQGATNSSETIGTLSFVRGIGTVTTTFGGTNVAALTAGQLLRVSGGGIGFVNGVNLGMDGTSTASIARLLLGTSPDLVGATAALSSGINAAVKNTSIVPYLVGVATATSGGVGTAGTVPNTFVTYDPLTGLRPLNPTDEFTANAIVTGDNTRLTATTVSATTTNINSLLIEGNGVGLTINSGTTLTVDSGAILFSSGLEPRIDGPGILNFGTREGIITINSTGNTFITSRISGSGGVTYHGSGNLVLAGQQSTYSGDTVLRVANVIPQASSMGPAGAPVSGAFGTGRLILDGSAIRATTAGDITIGNEVVIRANTTIPDTVGARKLIFTGPVTLEGGDRTLTQNSSADTIFNGSIGDAGDDLGLRLSGTGTGALVLSAANTYSGGTIVEEGTLLVNNVSGSGTGTGLVSVENGGTLGGSGFIVSTKTTVESGGNISPGNPGVDGGVGTLTFTGDLETKTGSTWLIDIVQNEDGKSDRVAVSGVLTIAGSILDLNFAESFTNGHVYTIASYGSLVGEFDGWAQDAVILNYRIDYGSGPNGVITLTAVPEPETVRVLLFALLALYGAHFYRRQRAAQSH